MNVHIDLAGYIVMLTALVALAAFCLAVFFGIKDGSRSKNGVLWVANTGRAFQLLGLSLACSATTMPIPPLVFFMFFGMVAFFAGGYLRRDALSIQGEKH